MYAPSSSVGVRIDRKQHPSKLVDLARQAKNRSRRVWRVELLSAAGIATDATALAVTSTIKVGIGVLRRSPATRRRRDGAGHARGLHPGRLIGGWARGGVVDA